MNFPSPYQAIKELTTSKRRELLSGLHYIYKNRRVVTLFSIFTKTGEVSEVPNRSRLVWSPHASYKALHVSYNHWLLRLLVQMP